MKYYSIYLSKKNSLQNFAAHHWCITLNYEMVDQLRIICILMFATTCRWISQVH